MRQESRLVQSLICLLLFIVNTSAGCSGGIPITEQQKVTADADAGVKSRPKADVLSQIDSDCKPWQQTIQSKTGHYYYQVERSNMISGSRLRIDANGSLYVAGRVRDGLQGLEQESFGSWDIFLSKFTSDGTVLWSSLFGTEGTDEVHDFVVDSNGDLLILASMATGVRPQGNSTYKEVYLLKYDAKGQRLWQRGPLKLSSGILSLAIDHRGNYYVAGTHIAKIDGMVRGSGNDSFVIKYSPSLTERWQLDFVAEGKYESAVIRALAIDSRNDVIVTGSSSGNLRGSRNRGAEDILVAKVASNGRLLWSKLIGTREVEFGIDVAIDTNNDICLVAQTRGVLEGEDGQADANGLFDLYVAKLNSAGADIWSAQLGGTKSVHGSHLVVDGARNVYVSGHTLGGLDGQGNEDGSASVFIVRYGSDGTKRGTKLINSPEEQRSAGLVIDDRGNCYCIYNTRRYPHFGTPLGIGIDVKLEVTKLCE